MCAAIYTWAGGQVQPGWLGRPSVTREAATCEAAIQEGMAARNEDVPEDRRITVRIGVHLGGVMVEDDDLYGDGVNVAACLLCAQPR